MPNFSLTRFPLSKALIAFCLLLPCLFIGGAQAQVATSPTAAPTITNVAGLTAALQKGLSVAPVTVSTQVVGVTTGQYHLSQVGAYAAATVIFSHQKYTLPSGGTSLSPLFTNFSCTTSVEVVGAGPLSIQCVVEDANGSKYPVSFRGLYTGTLTKGGPLVADPVPIYVAPGGFIFVDTMVTLPAAGADISIAASTNPSNTDGSGVTLTPSTTDPMTATLPVNAGGYYFGPTSIVGLLPAGAVSVNVYGDSISVASPGYVFEALSSVLPFVHNGYTGHRYSTLESANGQVRESLFAYATHNYLELGTNDLSADNNASTVQALAQLLINYGTSMATKSIIAGNKPVFATLLPRTKTTVQAALADTVATQVRFSNDASRQCYNDWVRGASIATLNSTYGITLSAGTKTVAQVGVTLPCVELADLLEVNSSNVLTRNGSYYRTPSAAYLTGTAGAASSNSSIVGTFTASALVNMTLKMTSGAASGQEIQIFSNTTGSIAAYFTGTGVLPGDTYSVFAVYTNDGTHPSTNLVNGYKTIRDSGVFTSAVFH